MSLAAVMVGVMLLSCYAVAILTLRAAIRDIRYGLASRSWPTTDAFLEKCMVAPLPTSRPNSWHLVVKYSYVVAGARYTGDCVAFGYSGSSNRERHEATRRKILGRNRLPVRYCPEQPEVSALLPSTRTWMFAMSFFALFWWTCTLIFTAIVLVVSGIGPEVLEWFS